MDSQKKRRAKVKPKVYLKLRSLIDPATGREVAAFVASGDADKYALRERDLALGDIVRAELTKPRNEQFHRLVHALGAILSENVSGYEGLKSHDAIKKLQLEAKVYCDAEEMQVLDMALVRYIPQSISYDSMDETTFQDFWKQCCKYLAEKYWSNMSYDEFNAMIDEYDFH